jgi:hypothetical protein
MKRKDLPEFVSSTCGCKYLKRENKKFIQRKVQEDVLNWKKELYKKKNITVVYKRRK